jgi:hypothetical protein
VTNDDCQQYMTMDIDKPARQHITIAPHSEPVSLASS